MRHEAEIYRRKSEHIEETSTTQIKTKLNEIKWEKRSSKDPFALLCRLSWLAGLHFVVRKLRPSNLPFICSYNPNHFFQILHLLTSNTSHV